MEQMTVFDFLQELEEKEEKTFKVEKLNLLSLFSGIGAFEKALERMSIPYNLINYCEIDKYASKAFALIHNIDESKNLKDVRSIKAEDIPQDIHIISYGFPCQDISNCGYKKGFFDGDGNVTRSGLFFEALRIIESAKPKIAIAENVRALTSNRFKTEFKIVLNSLSEAGYVNYWKVLNSQDFDVPQNRERVFIISIRKDIDKGFEFPNGHRLEKHLRDILEANVDSKYYPSEDTLKYILSSGTKGFYYKPDIDLDVARPLTCTMHKSHRAGQDNYVSDSFVQNGEKLFIREANKNGFSEAEEGDFINLQFLKSTTRRGRIGKQVSQTLCCNDNNAVVEKRNNALGIRKLTPKECFRLMGFDDKDVDLLMENNISNTQLYRMAGNSIVVDTLIYIYICLFQRYEKEFAT